MDFARAGFAKQARQLSNQSGDGMAPTKSRHNSLASIYFLSTLNVACHFLGTNSTRPRPYLSASALCIAVSPLSKPRQHEGRGKDEWRSSTTITTTTTSPPPFSTRRDSSSFSLWIAVQSGAVLWLVCVTHISVSTIAAPLYLDTHIKDCHFKGHWRAMQTSVASGRLGREGSRLERVCSVRECQVYAGSPGSSLLSVLLCLRLFSAPLPPDSLLQSSRTLLLSARKTTHNKLPKKPQKDTL